MGSTMDDESRDFMSCFRLEAEGEINGFVDTDRCSLGYHSAF